MYPVLLKTGRLPLLLAGRVGDEDPMFGAVNGAGACGIWDIGACCGMIGQFGGRSGVEDGTAVIAG